MEYKIKPENWQCPQCLQPIGLIGRGLAKVFGNRMHDCDYSNIANKKPVIDKPVEDVNWWNVIDQYIQLVRDETAKADEGWKKKPFTLCLKVVRYPRGLALNSSCNGDVFLNHIVSVSYEYLQTNFLISMLEIKKTYPTQRPSVASVYLDPYNITFPEKWREYICPTIGSLEIHMVNGAKFYYAVPPHLKDQAIGAVNKMLQTGKTQIIEYIPEPESDFARGRSEDYSRIIGVTK